MYNTEFVPDPDLMKEMAPGYRAAVKGVAKSAADLIHKEFLLVREELRESLKSAQKHMVEAVTYGVLLYLSILPFMAFAIIGLGDIMEGRYWLSSLVVGVVTAIAGQVLSTRALRKIREDDFKLTRSKLSLEQLYHSMNRQLHRIKNTTTGGNDAIISG